MSNSHGSCLPTQQSRFIQPFGKMAQYLGVLLILLQPPFSRCSVNGQVQADDPASIEFFETKIRPVLIEHCYPCHNTRETQEGGLRLDLRSGLLEGGTRGPAVIPGDASGSLLIQALEHQDRDLRMPPIDQPLGAAIVADFKRWIEAGAVDPRHEALPKEQVAGAISWDKVLEERKQWWSFRPIQPQPNASMQSPADAIDGFISAKLRENGLLPSGPATDSELIRRLYFVLIGLPPKLDEYQYWSNQLSESQSNHERSQVVAQLVDALLASPHFGERWARHWMDWIRYAESHGSEGDPVITNAWMYRDYLIRSLNADVPLDTMIQEHIAGDLLPPRIDPQSGFNESLLATAHWRMVFHGFSPIDALEEQVRFVDDQINAFSKAFLGITVSCARCHHHKFDPISQEDYYALYGILSSCRPGRSPAESREVLLRNRQEMSALKREIRSKIADSWGEGLDQLRDRVSKAAAEVMNQSADQRSEAQREFWKPYIEIGSDEAIAKTANKLQTKQSNENSQSLHWDFSDAAARNTWHSIGVGLEENTALGELILSNDGESTRPTLHSGGVTSRAFSDKDAARFSSPDFVCPPDSVLWFLAEGDQGATLRYVVHHYPRNGTIYPTQPLRPGLKWYSFDVSYWSGDQVHLEITTAMDAPLLTTGQPRSWFRLIKAAVLPKGISPENPLPSVLSMLKIPDSDLANLQDTTDSSKRRGQMLEKYVELLDQAIKAFQSEELSATQSHFLNLALEIGLLELPSEQQETINQIFKQYRQLEQEVPVAIRVPCLQEVGGNDAKLFLRGDHRKPDKSIHRGFLSAIDASPYVTAESGRRELAASILAKSNPLTRRVLSNRIWHHLFGSGLVATPDNFGRLGSLPTHPELIDWLAKRLDENRWSLKATIRELVMTQAWQRSSVASQQAALVDPQNLWLSHANLRRYEAEVVRDAILLVSNNLDHRLFGEPVFNDQKAVGSKRRSIYLPVHRNSLVPLLRTFDFPEPFSSVGRRDTTNVPAQSLTLMNDSFLVEQSLRFAESVLAGLSESSKSPEHKLGEASSENTLSDSFVSAATVNQAIKQMIQSCMARPARADEIAVLSSMYEVTSQQFHSAIDRYQEFQNRMATLDALLNSLQQVAKTRIVQSRFGDQSLRTQQAPKLSDLESSIPKPLKSWNFQSLAKQQTSPSESHSPENRSDLSLMNIDKKIGHSLIVGDNSYAVSHPLEKSIGQKTLIAVVQLDNLTQRGGGVVSLQSLDGSVFDAIVFGELKAKQWLAGSNNFSRTASFDGPEESTAETQPVHLAIAYDDDGTIRAYRNGEIYGQPYQSAGLQTFLANQSVLTLGLRHLPVGGNRSLHGRILHVSLYDQALQQEQIVLLARDYLPPSREELLCTLTQQERDQWVIAEQELAVLSEEASLISRDYPWLNGLSREQQLAAIGKQSLSQVARTLFTLKEFIYVP